MLRPERVEPRHQRGKLLAPVDLLAHVEVAEHARGRDGADIELSRIGRCLGESSKPEKKVPLFAKKLGEKKVIVKTGVRAGLVEQRDKFA